MCSKYILCFLFFKFLWYQDEWCWNPGEFYHEATSLTCFHFSLTLRQGLAKMARLSLKLWPPPEVLSSQSTEITGTRHCVWLSPPLLTGLLDKQKLSNLTIYLSYYDFAFCKLFKRSSLLQSYKDALRFLIETILFLPFSSIVTIRSHQIHFHMQQWGSSWVIFCIWVASLYSIICWKNCLSPYTQSCIFHKLFYVHRSVLNIILQ